MAETAGGARVEIQGLRNLVRTLVKAGVDVADMKAANARVGQIVVRAGNQIVPRASGRLAASIRPAQQRAAVVVRAGSGGIPYAGVQHWGWPRRHIRATLFLTTAIERERGQIEDEYFDELDKIIGTVRGE